MLPLTYHLYNVLFSVNENFLPFDLSFVMVIIPFQWIHLFLMMKTNPIVLFFALTHKQKRQTSDSLKGNQWTRNKEGEKDCIVIWVEWLKVQRPMMGRKDRILRPILPGVKSSDSRWCLILMNFDAIRPAWLLWFSGYPVACSLVFTQFLLTWWLVTR